MQVNLNGVGMRLDNITGKLKMAQLPRSYGHKSD